MNYINLVSSFFITGLSLFALKPMAGKVGLLDIPGGRKTHTSATPMVGGLGIFFGTFSMCLFTPAVLSEYATLLAISAFVLIVGLFDDAKDLKVGLRMSLHALAAVGMILIADVQLVTFGSIFGSEPTQLGYMSVPITILATVGLINAINMSDGIDGLSGGMVISALFMLGIVALLTGSGNSFGFIVVLSCSVLAFLTLNFRRPWKKRALIYLGDAGSTMLGFMLAWLLIASTQSEEGAVPPVVVLWFVTIPLFDTVQLLINRPLSGRSAFLPGTDHLHHRLIRLGFTVEQIVFRLILASLCFGLIGLSGWYLGVSEMVMFSLFIGLFIVYSMWCKVSKT